MIRSDPGLAASRTMLDDLLTAAARGRDVVKGVAMGPKPRFFVIGDEPCLRDLVIGRPFSGPLSDVLVAAVETIRGRYNCGDDDFYVTYLVKSIFRPNELTEKMITDEWVPAAQLEFQLSGCEHVVAIGRVARLFAGVISQPPATFAQTRPSMVEKVRQAWQLLSA